MAEEIRKVFEEITATGPEAQFAIFNEQFDGTFTYNDEFFEKNWLVTPELSMRGSVSKSTFSFVDGFWTLAQKCLRTNKAYRRLVAQS